MTVSGAPPRQAAAIPVRQHDAAVEVCLIRRLESKHWGIPKGFIEPGDTPEGAALNEAWEEAGVTGRVRGSALGLYEYEKWGQTLLVAVYLMDVLEERTAWPEMSLRERKWVALADLDRRLKHHPVRVMLDVVHARIGEDGRKDMKSGDR